VSADIRVPWSGLTRHMVVKESSNCRSRGSSEGCYLFRSRP
jgi:hypothetical protein